MILMIRVAQRLCRVTMQQMNKQISSIKLAYSDVPKTLTGMHFFAPYFGGLQALTQEIGRSLVTHINLGS